MIELPNDQWVRSTKQPNWALCLEPANRFYGWKMYECNGRWVSGAKLTRDEVDTALTLAELHEHKQKLAALRSTLGENDAT